MLTIITINGVDYDGGPTGWAAQGITNMEFQWDIENPWSFSFSVYRKCNGAPPYPAGSTITLDTTEDDGSGRRHVFVGDLQRPEGQRVNEGYCWNYAATDLKTRGNYVGLTALDGSGTASFNLSPDDPLALYATSGLTVGDILKALLEQTDNATALDAAGIGNYVSLSPPALPAATLADLAAMTVVPNGGVQLRGESLLNTLEQWAIRWHPQYCSWIDPADGTIRYQSIFALTPQAVALPGADGSGADVDWPNLVVDISDCYTAWQITGLDIQSTTLRTVDGTLWGKGAGPGGSPKSGWTAAQETAWTIADFISPKNASDYGALSSVTSASATVTSDQATTHWAANFWNGTDVQGWVWLQDLSASGIDIYENRQITSCTALTAGGSATITWDSSVPLNSTAYTRYAIKGNATPQSLVGREFYVREPATGATGRDTFVGSHLVVRNSKGMPVANNSRVINVFYAYAFVQWSRDGAYPYFELPLNVQINPLHGSIILTEPAVLKSAALAGASSVLANRYPTTFAEGLYYNVECVVAYNRGALSARAPSSGFSGTAFTTYGLERVFPHRIDTFNWLGDQPSLVLLAEEHLKTVQDATVIGTLNFYELPTFDVFRPGFCLNVSVSGSSTPLDGLDLPVRAATIRWHDSPDPVLYSASLRFNNRHRPFEGDSLYIHPALGRNTFGMPNGNVFGAEMMGMAQIAAGMMQGNQFAGTPMGEHPMGQSPMGQDMGHNQIADAMSNFGGSSDVGGIGGIDQMGSPAPGRAASGAKADTFMGGAEQAKATQWQARADREAAADRKKMADPAHPESIMNMTGGGARINPDAPDNPDSIMNMRRPAKPGEKIDVSERGPLPTKPWQRPKGEGLAKQRGQKPPDPDDTQSGGAP